jgi:hypothetical protein
MGQGAGEAIAHMLRTNDTLTHFSIWVGNGLEPSDVCKILGSLQKNQTLLSLSLWGCQGVKGPDVSAKMMDLFQINRSLTNIDLSLTPLEQSDVCKILESLQKNQGLRYLRLSECKAVKGPDVLAKMMDLVRMHPCLMRIDLYDTPLEREGQAAQVQAQLENNAKDYMAVLRGMPRVPPKFVRVFLCGNAYSGNSTFSLSLIFLFRFHYLHLWNCVNHTNVFVMTPQWCLIQCQHSHTYSFLNLNHMSFETKNS